MSLAAEYEQIIRHNRMPALENDLQGAEFILPYYGGLSIANLPATIAGLFGTEYMDAVAQAGVEPALPRRAWSDMAEGVRSVIMVVLDAVGYLDFSRLLNEKDTVFDRLAQEGRLVPLTSVFPSTTMAAMSSLWTGRTPGDHGFLGRRLFLPEFGVLADMIRLMPAIHGKPGSLLQWGWVPEDFIPVPALAQLLSAVGIKTVAHLYGPHVGSGLSRLFLRGVGSVEGFNSYSDMWINLRHTLLQHPKEPFLTYAYWSGTDDVAHKYGPDGERFQAALRQIGRSLDEDFLKPLDRAARDGTVLIIIADHGQVETPPERAVHLADHPALKEMLFLPPAAEPRASYLYVRPGKIDSVRAYVEEHLADRFLLLDMDRAVSAGLFGPSELAAESRARLGDVLLLARDDGRLIPEGATAKDRGEHGTLTPKEMLVPLLMVRLDN